MTDKTYTILSLGAGVQSSVLLLLSCRGILPKPDLAIFADTQWEPQAVYQHLWWLAEQATTAGIPVVVDSRGDIRADALRAVLGGLVSKGERYSSMPFFIRGPDGKIGMLQRQCTREFKLEVVVRAIRAHLGLKSKQRVPADVQVTQWIGISINEKQRMRINPHRWLTNEYPLIGWPTQFLMLGRPWSRVDCESWFAEQYPGRVLPSSSCIGCPFNSDARWVAMRTHHPGEFAEACEFDRNIRHCGGKWGETYLHKSCMPLSEVDFSMPDPRQLSFAAECLGMCGT